MSAPLNIGTIAAPNPQVNRVTHHPKSTQSGTESARAQGGKSNGCPHTRDTLSSRHVMRHGLAHCLGSFAGELDAAVHIMERDKAMSNTQHCSCRYTKHTRDAASNLQEHASETRPVLAKHTTPHKQHHTACVAATNDKQTLATLSQQKGQLSVCGLCLLPHQKRPSLRHPTPHLQLQERQYCCCLAASVVSVLPASWTPAHAHLLPCC